MSTRSSRNNIQAMQFEAERHGGMLLDEVWVDSNFRYQWQCSKGHVWRERKGKILAESKWCPYCDGTIIDPVERTLEMNQLALSRNGRMLSRSWIDSKTKYEWQCQQGHTWKTTWASVRRGSWCPKCSVSAPRSIEELSAVVEARKGQLLTSEYRGVNGTYEFECNLGHNFSNQFHHVVNRGQWCPICSKGTKSEELTRTCMEQIFGTEFRRIRPSWLKNEEGRTLELDGYSEVLNIAFEYQGRQHFENQFYLGEQDLPKRIRDDLQKEETCKDKGIHLFIFTYKDNYLDFQRIAKTQAQAFGIDITKYQFEQPIDFNRAYIREDKLETVKRNADKVDVDVISTKWLGAMQRYQFYCRKCESAFEAEGRNYTGNRTTRCPKCVLQMNFNPSTLGINKLQEYAARYGGELLTTTYQNMHQLLSWKCSEGHIFEAQFNNMSRRNQWCAICEGRAKKRQFNQVTAGEFFSANGLELIDTYRGVGQAHKTKCTKCGRVKNSRINLIREGTNPCPGCPGA